MALCGLTLSPLNEPHDPKVRLVQPSRVAFTLRMTDHANLPARGKGKSPPPKPPQLGAQSFGDSWAGSRQGQGGPQAAHHRQSEIHYLTLFKLLLLIEFRQQGATIAIEGFPKGPRLDQPGGQRW